MGENTKIEWCDHTFNAWWGCTKVSPGCDHCYANAFDKRLGGGHWGPGAERRTFGEKHWNEPRKWNAAAERDGVRRRVFCSSMADVFDAEAPAGELDKLWALIRETPHLDWQLLTKRIERVATCLPSDWVSGYPNVWLGTTVENQAQCDRRVPRLLCLPAATRFLSMEPLLERVDLSPWLGVEGEGELGPITWVIVGGESGHGARPFHAGWGREIVLYCRVRGVACFVKQLGANPLGYTLLPLNMGDGKGGNIDEFPEELRVREFPEARAR